MEFNEFKNHLTFLNMLTMDHIPTKTKKKRYIVVFVKYTVQS